MTIHLYSWAMELVRTDEIAKTAEGPVPDVITWDGRAFIRNDMLDVLDGVSHTAIGYIEAVRYELAS